MLYLFDRRILAMLAPSFLVNVSTSNKLFEYDGNLEYYATPPKRRKWTSSTRSALRYHGRCRISVTIPTHSHSDLPILSGIDDAIPTRIVAALDISRSIPPTARPTDLLVQKRRTNPNIASPIATTMTTFFAWAICSVFLALSGEVASAGSSAEVRGEDSRGEPNEFVEYAESPTLRTLVASGDLPPIDDRLPARPIVLTSSRNAAPDGLLDIPEVGHYGGNIRLCTFGGHFRLETYCMNAESLLLRPGSITHDSPITGGIIELFDIEDDNNTVFLMSLREGLKWSDGHPVTTDDVVFVYEDILQHGELTPLNRRPEYVLDVIDDYTYRVTFPEPTHSYLDELADPTRDYTSVIQPKHYLSQFHPEYVDADTLSARVHEGGFERWTDLFESKRSMLTEPMTQDDIAVPVLHPWKLVEITGNDAVLERNPYYYKVDSAYQQLPYIDKITVTNGSNRDECVLKILVGDVDVASSSRVVEISDLPKYRSAADRVRMRVITSLTYVYNPVVHAFNFTYNNGQWETLVDQLGFRQALNLSIDRREIIETVYHGLAAEPVWVSSEFDQDRARLLLDEVGLVERDGNGWRVGPEGNRFEIVLFVASEPPTTVKVHELIAEQYQQVGIRTKVETVLLWDLLRMRSDNELMIDTIPSGAATDHGVPYAARFLLQPNPGWRRWSEGNSDSESFPPSEWFQELYSVARELHPSRLADYESTVARYQELFRTYIPQINVTYNPPRVTILNENLGNVFTQGAAEWLIYSAEQLYYKDNTSVDTAVRAHTSIRTGLASTLR